MNAIPKSPRFSFISLTLYLETHQSQQPSHAVPQSLSPKASVDHSQILGPLSWQLGPHATSGFHVPASTASPWGPVGEASALDQFPGDRGEYLQRRGGAQHRYRLGLRDDQGGAVLGLRSVYARSTRSLGWSWGRSRS